MNYGRLTDTIFSKVMLALALINNPEITPEVRQFNLEILFREVGAAVYAKIYDMNAFDFGIEHTVGEGMDDRYYGLAKKASYSVSTGDVAIADQVRNFINQCGAQAQQHAMTNARQSGHYPSASRRTVGDTCKWCRSLAAENVENPPAEFFHRHAGCDCQIITKGYKSRNGLLQNYVKPKDR